jgi:hypothetical protein
MSNLEQSPGAAANDGAGRPRTPSNLLRMALLYVASASLWVTIAGFIGLGDDAVAFTTDYLVLAAAMVAVVDGRCPRWLPPPPRSPRPR